MKSETDSTKKIIDVSNTYTRTAVTKEAMKVPTIAKVIIAPKFEKNGFCLQHQ